MNCERNCPHAATWLVRITFWSTRRIVAYLCDHHADRLYFGLMPTPQVKSGSKTSLSSRSAAA